MKKIIIAATAALISTSFVGAAHADKDCMSYINKPIIGPELVYMCALKDARWAIEQAKKEAMNETPGNREDGEKRWDAIDAMEERIVQLMELFLEDGERLDPRKNFKVSPNG